MEPDEGVVQDRIQPCTEARLTNPQEDHGGEGRYVSPHTNPGVEHPHICRDFPGGSIGTYVGQDQVGGV